MNDYLKYRGKCKELAEEKVSDCPDLRLVRGYYYCPIFGTKEQHWWTEDREGNIFDPSKDQFPSKGTGTYEEFDGYLECCQCGKRIREEDAIIHGRYGACTPKCMMMFVGL